MLPFSLMHNALLMLVRWWSQCFMYDVARLLRVLLIIKHILVKCFPSSCWNPGKLHCCFLDVKVHAQSHTHFTIERIGMTNTFVGLPLFIVYYLLFAFCGALISNSYWFPFKGFSRFPITFYRITFKNRHLLAHWWLCYNNHLRFIKLLDTVIITFFLCILSFFFEAIIICVDKRDMNAMKRW